MPDRSLIPIISNKNISMARTKWPLKKWELHCSMLVNIHFYHIWKPFFNLNKWLPRDHHAHVLRQELCISRLKIYTVKRQESEKRKFKRMLSFLFVEEGRLVIEKLSFEEFSLVFFTTERMVCFEMQPCKQWSFCWIFRYILHSMAKTITFLKGNLCIFKCFIDVL